MAVSLSYTASAGPRPYIRPCWTALVRRHTPTPRTPHNNWLTVYGMGLWRYADCRLPYGRNRWACRKAYLPYNNRLKPQTFPL